MTMASKLRGLSKGSGWQGGMGTRLSRWFARRERRPMGEGLAHLRFEPLEDRRLLSVWTPVVDSVWFSSVSDGLEGVGEDTEEISWQGDEIEVVSGEWLVQLTESATESAGSVAGVESLLGTALFDREVVRGLGMEGLVLVQVESGVSVTAIDAWLGDNTNVAYYEPNGVATLCDTTPNDEYYEDLWGLENTGREGARREREIVDRQASEPAVSPSFLAAISLAAAGGHGDVLRRRRAGGPPDTPRLGQWDEVVLPMSGGKNAPSGILREGCLTGTGVCG